MVSYGSIGTIITGADIEVVEAWGAMGGAITALDQIGLVRSGDEITAAITGAVVGDVNEFDPDVFATQYPDKPEISLESFKAWIRGLQRDLLGARDQLVEMRAGSFRLLAAEEVAAREGANPTLGDRREAEAVVTVAVNELLVALATASEADVQALKEANRNLDYATRQLQPALGKGRVNSDFDLQRSQDIAELAADELTERLGTRDDARSKLLAEKEAQMQGAMTRFDAAEASWTTTFASKVDDLISSRLNAALDTLQFILDALGFIPGVGAIPDLISAQANWVSNTDASTRCVTTSAAKVFATGPQRPNCSNGWGIGTRRWSPITAICVRMTPRN